MGRPLDMDMFFFLYVFVRSQDAPDTPKMAPKDTKMAKMAPRPPRSSLDPSKTVPDAFKTAQDESNTL